MYTCTYIYGYWWSCALQWPTVCLCLSRYLNNNGIVALPEKVFQGLVSMSTLWVAVYDLIVEQFGTELCLFVCYSPSINLKAHSITIKNIWIPGETIFQGVVKYITHSQDFSFEDTDKYQLHAYFFKCSAWSVFVWLFHLWRLLVEAVGNRLTLCKESH